MIASTADGMKAILVMKDSDGVTMNLTFDVPGDKTKEAKARSFFRALVISPAQDYLAMNGSVPNSIRCVGWPIPGDAASITAITGRVLRELYGISDSEALTVQYEEKN